MYAIIKTGGKQYKVSEGVEIIVEKLDVEEGAQVTFDEVLAIVDGENVKVGRPKVEGAKVTGKYKHKTNYRRRMGHRQPFTKVKIDKVAG